MRFILFVIDDRTNTASSEEIANIDKFNQSLQDGGQFIMAAGISSPDGALLIDNRTDKATVEKRSFFSDQFFYSGFWLIKTDSAEQAQQLALAGSKACNRRVELRAFLGQ